MVARGAGSRPLTEPFEVDERLEARDFENVIVVEAQLSQVREAGEVGNGGDSAEGEAEHGSVLEQSGHVEGVVHL